MTARLSNGRSTKRRQKHAAQQHTRRVAQVGALDGRPRPRGPACCPTCAYTGLPKTRSVETSGLTPSNASAGVVLMPSAGHILRRLLQVVAVLPLPTAWG